MNKSLLRRYLEFIRFSHTVFALPFAALACVWAVVTPAASVPGGGLLASGHPDAGYPGDGHLSLTVGQIAIRCLGVLLCMITARSAAMAFNRLVDASFDADNPRTAGRHLPSGQLSYFQAWVFFVVMAGSFLAACGLFWPNWLPLAGALPVLLWICGYSLAKRFTTLVHLWLGVALALAPVCAWIAMRGELVLASPWDLLPAVVLAVAIACWVAGFDIIYACQDAEFDAQRGLRSLPALLGIQGALRVAAGLHVLMLLVLGGLPWIAPQLSLGGLYAAAWCLVAGLVGRQHAVVQPQGADTIDVGRINHAFFQINAVISFVLAAAAASDACLR